jgi:hypothetical protein
VQVYKAGFDACAERRNFAPIGGHERSANRKKRETAPQGSKDRNGMSLAALGLFNRKHSTAVAAAVLIGWSVSSAAAVAKKPTAPVVAAKTDVSPKPALVASFGDWGVYVGQVNKARICYALAQPKTREPAGLQRDPAYAFISDRPAEGVHNEVSFIMGFDVAAGPDAADPKKTSAAIAPIAVLGDQTVDLLPKASNLWVKNPAREVQFIELMRKSGKLQIKAASLRGHVTIDSYMLAGFAQAMDRLQKECPGK